MSALTRWLGHRNRMALAAGAIGAAALAFGTTASLGGFSASITNTGDQVATGNLVMQETVMPSGSTAVTCLSTATGTALSGPSGTNNAANCNANKFGSITNGVPGSTSSSNVVLTNLGSVPANTFTLTTGACGATPTIPTGGTAQNVGSDTAGYCGKIDVTIEDDTTTGSPSCVYGGPSGAACPTPTNTYNLATLSAAYNPANTPTAGTPLALVTPVAAKGTRTYKVTVLIDPTATTNADQAMSANLPITFTFGS